MHGMATPTGRVLAALEVLQSRHHVTGAELAARLDVDRRTVRRYVAHLVDLGVPVETTRGPDGGYRLGSGYKLPPLVFGPDEALAIAVGLRAAAQLGLAGIAPAVAAVQAKLERVLPGAVRQRLQDIERTVDMDLRRPLAPGSPEALLALGSAARLQQRVHLRYVDASGEATERDVDPYGVAYRGGAWYAVGWCHLRRDLRSFRLDRVAGVAPLPASFGRPEGFDILRHLTLALATLPRAHRVEVRLHVDLESARRVLAPELAVLEPVRGGGVRLRAQVDELAVFARELARLPFAFTIVSPQRLKQAFAEHVRALVRTAARPAARNAASPRARSGRAA
jgi:predicted DNA-binding transcriptional regulator YafY